MATSPKDRAARRSQPAAWTATAAHMPPAPAAAAARTYTKLTVACDAGSHFLAGATVATGPSNDSPQFRPAMAQASLVVAWDRVLADAAFDSEAHHAYAREDRHAGRAIRPGDGPAVRKKP